MSATQTSNLTDIDTSLLLLDIIGAATELADKCCWAKGFDSKAHPYPQYFRFNGHAFASREANALRKAIMAAYYKGVNFGYGRKLAIDTLAARGVSKDVFAAQAWR
jgi:hypothetical protein